MVGNIVEYIGYYFMFVIIGEGFWNVYLDMLFFFIVFVLIFLFVFCKVVKSVMIGVLSKL